MEYNLIAFFSILSLASVHFLSAKMEFADRIMHGRLLSVGGGIAIAYVFVDLLPNLSKSDKSCMIGYQNFSPILKGTFM